MDTKQFRLIALIFSLGLGFSTVAQNYTLQECIDTAWAHNTRMAILNSKSQIVDSKAAEVKANLIPKVYLNGDYKYFIDLPYQLMPQSIFGGPEGSFKAVQFGVPHVMSANATVQIPIYMGQIFHAIDKVDLAKADLEIEIEKSKEAIYYEVTTLYRNAQLLQSNLDFLDSALVNATRLYRVSQSLQRGGLATGTDVKRVQLQMMALENQKLTVAATVQKVLDALKVYMGKSITSVLSIDPLIEDFEQALYVRNPSLALQSIELKQKMIETDINALQKTRYLPDVVSYGSLGTSGFGYNSTNNSFLDFYPTNFIGIKANYRLFNGTVTKKQIAQKQIELSITNLEKSAADDQLSLSLQKANSDLEIAVQNLALIDQQLVLSESIFTESKLLLKQGLASTTEVLQVNTEVLKMQQSKLLALVNCYSADLELKRLTRNILN